MVTSTSNGWLFWALLSAAFAALTAILAKLGVSGIDADLATLFRTIVIVVALCALLFVTDGFKPLGQVATRTWLFPTLSGLATGASWLCYFRALKVGDAARVAPIDKLSVVIVAIIGTAFLGEHLSARNWLGVVLIGIGAVLVALR